MIGLAKVVSYNAASGTYYTGKLIDLSGTYSTSQTEVTGTSTTFKKDFAIGSFLVDATNKEQRRVTSILSDTKMTIESAFSADRSGIATKKGLPTFVRYELITTGTGTTIDGVALVANYRFVFDSCGYGIIPTFVVHTNPVYLYGTTRETI
jgi:hypothetical protein